MAGAQLINDCNLELNLGSRYGLIGNNGCGKTAMINAIARREVELPGHLDMFHLHQEAAPSELTAVEAVVEHVKEELARLEKLEEAIIEESGADDDRLELISTRISELDPETFEVRGSRSAGSAGERSSRGRGGGGGPRGRGGYIRLPRRR